MLLILTMLVLLSIAAASSAFFLRYMPPAPRLRRRPGANAARSMSTSHGRQAEEYFTAIVSHQLRSLITEIKWELAGLFAADGSYTPPEREYIERLRASADRTERLTDLLLRFVTTEQEYGGTPAPYEADAAIREASEASAAQFRSKSINLEIRLDFGEKIAALDQEALTLIVGNLVDNAFRYTPSGGSIIVTSARGKDGSLEVTVKDTGMGITDAEKPGVFSRFHRSPRALQAYAGGSGLGLYVVKRILMRCGGSIDFTSAEGQGTTFRFIIPGITKESAT